jgi:MOSC domain
MAEAVRGRVESIHVAVAGGAPMQATREVELVPGKGIVGDRYFAGLGEFSPPVQDPDHELTLIEAEEIERFNADGSFAFEEGAFRRNLVTRGVRLNDLVGVEFRAGPATLRGVRLCEPCRYLAGFVHADVVSGMLHRCGLRAAIVAGGRLRVGDAVEA